MTRFGDNPVTSTVPIPPRRQPGCDTSTRYRREFKLNMSDPDLLIPIKQTRITTKLREPQPSSSDSQLASSQPVLETTASKSSVSLPSSPSGSSSTESTSTSGTDSIIRKQFTAIFECFKPRDKQFSQHITVYITQTVGDGVLFQQPACGYQRSSKPSSDEKPNGQLERAAAAYRCTEASYQPATEPTKACVSASNCKYATSPVSPKTSK